jgi:predicted Zn-dependent peptidase
MKSHPKIPRCKKTVLPNGVRILTDRITEMRSVSIGILVRAGSGDESDSEAGVSHFIEHMMFKGTPSRTAFQIAQELDAVGGRINAATGKESTIYYSVVLDERIDIAISVLSDIFLNSIFDPREIEVERGVILEEIRMYDDTPEELVHDLFSETIMSGHSMGRPIIGREKTVKSFLRENMLAYKERFYVPGNIIIAIAGNIDHDDVVTKLAPLFGYLKAGPKPARHKLPKIRKKIAVRRKDTEQVHISLGTKAVSQLDDKRYAFLALDNILGGSMSSRLFQEVREKRGLAYSIYSYASPYSDFGIWSVSLGTSMENYKKSVDLIFKEIVKIKKDGVTKEELDRAKEYVRGSLVLGLESTSSRMGWISKSEFYYGRSITVDEVFGKIDKITRNDIIKLANEYFKDEFLALAMVGNFKKGEEPLKGIKLS